MNRAMAFFEQAQSDDKIRSELARIQNDDNFESLLIGLAKSNGYECTAQELYDAAEAISRGASGGAKLSDSQLEAVVGGAQIGGTRNIGVVMAAGEGKQFPETGPKAAKAPVPGLD